MSHYNINWHAPCNIKGFITTKNQGNMGLHVTDDPHAVIENRKQALKNFDYLNDAIYLQQVHGTDVVIIDEHNVNNIFSHQADAMITKLVNQPLAIMTADCYPVLLCDNTGREIAAIHAGWRGAVNGVITNTISNMQTSADKLTAWIGPGICMKCFEVGEEVISEFRKKIGNNLEFYKQHNNKYLFNLHDCIIQILKHNNISNIFSASSCTFENENLFYSYRKNNITGRMATYIWINNF